MKTLLKYEGYEEDVSLPEINQATAGVNTGLKAPEAMFNASAVLFLIGRLHRIWSTRRSSCHLESRSMFKW